MGKKQFIDKKNSQKFHLLHRSQGDAAYIGDEMPSDLVLVPAENLNDRKKGIPTDAFFQDPSFFPSSSNSNKNDFSSIFAQGDHINELGLPNDGYDYSKHMKEAGDGTFISANGAFGTNPYAINKPVNLPDELFATDGPELDMNILNNITIDPSVMDKDLYAALFEDADSEGEFEVLDDDFVSQVIQEPETPDFDFDAHIAKLIAMSEQNTSKVKARGWSDKESRELLKKRINKKGGDEFVFYDIEEEEEEEDYEEECPELVGGALDAQFEKLMAEEYGDDDIGYANIDEDEIEGQGVIELTDDNFLIDQAYEELVQEEKDKKLEKGIVPLHYKGTRETIIRNVRKDNQEDEDFEDRGADEGDVYINKIRKTVDFKKEFQEQEQLQLENSLYLKELNNEIKKENDKYMETCQDYLREEKEELEWDCETILTTLSVTQNLPTKIGSKNAKFKEYKSSFLRKQEEKFNNENGPNGGKIINNAYNLNNPVLKTGKIVLSGKLGLPEGFGPNSLTTKKAMTKTQHRNKSLAKLAEITEDENEEEEEESEEEEEQDDDAEGTEDDNYDAKKEEKKLAKKKAHQKETSEEKRLRKQQVKEEQRMRRANKKQLKTAFKQEEVKISKNIAKEQTIDRVSVFRYSS